VTVALVALSLALAGLAAALVWSRLDARDEGRLAIAAAKEALTEREKNLGLTKERDDARAAASKLGAELNAAAAHAESLALDLAAALEELHDAKRQELVTAAPDDVPRVVNDQLRRRREVILARLAADAASADRGDAGAAPTVPGPGAATHSAGG